MEIQIIEFLLYMHLATYDQANSSRCWLVDDSQLFLTGQQLVFLLFIAIPTFFLNFKFFVTSSLLLFIEKLYLAILASYVYTSHIVTILLCAWITLVSHDYTLFHTSQSALLQAIITLYRKCVWPCQVCGNYTLQHLPMFKSLNKL